MLLTQLSEKGKKIIIKEPFLNYVTALGEWMLA